VKAMAYLPMMALLMNVMMFTEEGSKTIKMVKKLFSPDKAKIVLYKNKRIVSFHEVDSIL